MTSSMAFHLVRRRPVPAMGGADLLDLDGSFGRRDELSGLLDAYKAKAARLGAAEDPSLAAVHDQARELPWTAPCDLTAAADAVNRFQQAVLAVGAQWL